MDKVVREISEESLVVSGLGEGSVFRFVGFVGEVVKVRLEVVDKRFEILLVIEYSNMKIIKYLFVFEVEDFDGGSGSSIELVLVGGEDESVDNVFGVERVEVFVFVEVLEYGDIVFIIGGSEGIVGRDGEGVKVIGVIVVGGF